ncbi:MAG: hypothetical protein ACKV2V_10100 [Blastocatellia bacterium]
MATTPLPITLGGVSVTITDRNNVTRAAPLFFTSPGQVNFLVPEQTATGRARVTVKKQDGSATTGEVLVKAVAPGMFSANADGAGIATALATRVDAAGNQTYQPLSGYDTAEQRFVPVPLNPGAATDQTFLILFGTGWRAQSEFAGLDQINVGPLPRTLAGRNAVNVDVRIDSKRANRVSLTIQ